MIKTHLHGDILEIVINNAPVNALGLGVRKALLNELVGAQSNSAVRAIVVRGDGKLFSAGADITEFGAAPVAPLLPDVVDQIEASDKPVIAAIHGAALGGGLELAMGCHYRIATPKAKLGLPEVSLGLLPGAGGTQRLPRLVGVERALEMTVFGKPIAASSAAEFGLIDELAANDASLAGDAITFARDVVEARRTGERAISAEPAVFERFAEANARKLAGLDAPAACIEAIRLATQLPLAQGQAAERDLFSRLIDGDQSQALRHIFFAERAAAKIEGVAPDLPVRPIARVGIIGAGTMGGGIAMNFLSAGLPVTVVEMQQQALDHGVAVIRRNYEATAAKGRLTAAQVESAINLLTPTLSLEGLGECDLIIEAVYENMDVKRELFARLDSIAKPGALLASNTSFLSIDEIASATDRPGDVLGLHFFSPANVMQLLEVVRGKKTAPDALATAMQLARKIGKVPVVAGVCYGFIGNRMLAPRQDNALALLLEGATPEQVDRVHTAFGLPMGPFQMADLAGIDIGWHRDPTRIESLQDALCAAGRLGQKSKAGFYDYDDRRKATASPAVGKIVDDMRKRAGISAREISEDEIKVRTIYTLINEGAKILEENIAQRSSDIDVVWIYGYGWPRHKGGPMFWAQLEGLSRIVEGLTRYQRVLGDNFGLSPLLVAAAADGGGFDRSKP